METREDQQLKENIEGMRNLQDIILELKVTKSSLYINAPIYQDSCSNSVECSQYSNFTDYCFVCSKTENEATSIDAMAAGEDEPESGSKDAADESPSVC